MSYSNFIPFNFSLSSDRIHWYNNRFIHIDWLLSGLFCPGFFLSWQINRSCCGGLFSGLSDCLWDNLIKRGLFSICLSRTRSMFWLCNSLKSFHLEISTVFLIANCLKSQLCLHIAGSFFTYVFLARVPSKRKTAFQAIIILEDHIIIVPHNSRVLPT